MGNGNKDWHNQDRIWGNKDTDRIENTGTFSLMMMMMILIMMMGMQRKKMCGTKLSHFYHNHRSLTREKPYFVSSIEKWLFTCNTIDEVVVIFKDMDGEDGDDDVDNDGEGNQSGG